MHRWYSLAVECYAYLVDVVTLHTDDIPIRSELNESCWFRRRWTLQELIAPDVAIFLNVDWSVIGYKSRYSNRSDLQSRGSNPGVVKTILANDIAGVTGIPKEVLGNKSLLRHQSAAQRLSWMTLRHTSRIEDSAYCLFGIFDLNMPLLYGEGSNAFQRLQIEILRRTGDETILALSSVSSIFFPLSCHSY